MNTPKKILPGLAVLVAAALFVGANDAPADRPANVEASRWVKLSDTAGIALTGDPESSRSVSGQVYIRAGNTWRVVAIHNPARAELLGENPGR